MRFALWIAVFVLIDMHFTDPAEVPLFLVLALGFSGAFCAAQDLGEVTKK